MILKIEKIKNIGNYEDYIAAGDVSLKKMNLIYAENGSGKTTIARILHSMSVNDSSIISQRKRIGSNTPSEIIIKDEEIGQINYNENKWYRNNPNVIVFDTYFVSENVYTGFYISGDNRKHLYKFVLGDTGVEIAKKVERVKNLLEKNTKEINELYEQIITLSKVQDVEKVCAIKQLSEIDKLIEEKNMELMIAKDNDIILKQSKLPIFRSLNISFDIENLKKTLSDSINDIGKEYLELVMSNIELLNIRGIKDSSSWIYSGYQAIKNKDMDKCPFCGTPINGIKLIEGYNQFFSEKYKDTLNKINAFKKQISSINIDLYINEIVNINKQVKDLSNFWIKYVRIDKSDNIFEYDFDSLKSKFKKLIETIENKSINPLDSISPDIVDAFIIELNILSSKIKEINTYINLCNNKITDAITKVRKVSEVQKELENLELNKARFNFPLYDKCLKYKLFKEHRTRLQKINKSLQEEQKTESNRIFQQYGDKINYYLHDIFRTKFQIIEIKDGGFKGKAKEANLSYTLTFNGTPIEQDGESNTSFKNVLSEGDKNTIAFSLFLAKLKLSPNLSNKIIVFDDPLTSLDLNRRNATIHQLTLLYQNANQVIVLSHNLHFLIELNSRSIIKTSTKKALQIINIDGKSSIKEFLIKKEWIDNYQKSLISMNNFLSDPNEENKEEAINSIRISLETFLKLKYCLFIPDPDQTFGTIINNLQKSSCVFINPDKDSVIDKLNQLVAISWRGHHGSIEERDIYSEVDLSIHEAQNYVNMTLDLLNKEL